MDIAELGIKIDSRDANIANQALKTLANTGAEAEKSAGEVSRAHVIQAASLRMSARDAQLFKLAMGGATEAQIRQSRSALDAVDAQAKLDAKMKDLQVSSVAVGKAIGLAFAGAITAVTAFMVFFDKAMDKLANYKDVAEKSGIADPSSLATMRTALDVTGTSVDTFGSSLNQMQKQLARGSDESKGAARALSMVGISIDDFRKLDPVAQFKTLSGAMNGVADSGGKVALIQDIMGRGAGAMLPLMKEWAANGDSIVTVTNEMIEGADGWKDANAASISQLRQMSEVAMTLALPTMTALRNAAMEFAMQLIGVSDNATTLERNTAIQNFAESAGAKLAAFADIVVGVIREIRNLGLGIGSLAAAAGAFLSIDLTSQESIAAGGRKIREIHNEYNSQIIKSREGKTISNLYKEELEKIKLYSVDAGDAVSRRMRGAASGKIDVSGYTGREAKEDKTGERAARQAESEYGRLIGRIQERIALGEEEVKLGRKLTANEKERQKVEAALNNPKSKLSEAQKDAVRAELAIAEAIDAKLEKRERELKLWHEITAMHEKNAEEVAADRVKQDNHFNSVEKGLRDQAISMEQNNELLDAEIKLVGMSSEMRTATLEVLRMEIDYQNTLKEINDDINITEERKIILREKALRISKAQVDAFIKQEKLTDAQKLNAFLDPKKASSFGDALTKAFGSAGTSLGTLTNLLTEYGEKQAEIEAMRAIATAKGVAGEKELAQVNERASVMQMQNYGNMASAAAGFFDKQSSGYKVLMGVSQAFHAAEIAMQLASIAPKLMAGAAAMFGQSGWGGFAGVAAMGAVMAGLGYAMSGGGGGGRVGPSARDIQAGQGAGGVLGDPTAKSQTLKDSMALMDRDFDNSKKMLRALLAIERNIGGLASAISRQMGVAGSMFDSSGLGIGETKRWGSAVFGGNRSTTLKDRGLMFDAQTIGQAAQGISGASYQTTNTVKEGGWFSKDKSWDTTTRGAIDPEINRWMTQTIDSLRDGVVTAAGTLGIMGAEATVNSLQLGLSQISMMGLTGTEIQEQIEAVMSKAFDDMALALSPQLLNLGRVGEGSGETMMRLANTLTVVNGTLDSVGMRLFDISVNGAAAATALADTFGGLEEFKDVLGSYYDKFYSAEEKRLNTAKRIAATLAAEGGPNKSVEQILAMTRAQWRTELEGYASMGEAGDKAATAMLLVSDAVASIAKESESMSDVYERQIDLIQGSVDKFKSLIETLKTAQDNLLLNESLSPLTPQQRYEEAAQQFAITRAQALSGDADAAGRLEGVATTFLELSRSMFASSTQYNNDFARVMESFRDAETYSRGMVIAGERDIDVLKAQLTGLTEIRDAVRSVETAITSPSTPATAAATSAFPTMITEIQALRAEVTALRVQAAQGTGAQIDATYDATQAAAQAQAAATIEAAQRTSYAGRAGMLL